MTDAFNRPRFLAPAWLPHLLAIAASSAYAWQISQTAYVKTGVQFISPLLVLMSVHLIWLRLGGKLPPGYAQSVLYRTLVSACALALIVPVLEILSPLPSEAALADEISRQLRGILALLFCFTVLAAVIALAAAAIYAVFRFIAYIVRSLPWGGPGGGQMNEAASLALVFGIVLGTSFEGLPIGFAFDSRGKASVSEFISASPEDVWETMQTATAPEFPLPEILQMFPQPVAVLVDEGTELGSERVVLLSGREGQGMLRFRVVESTGASARFEVVSDTSPISNWIAIRSLTYEIKAVPDGSLLTISLGYDRLLAPSWAFTPMMAVAARLAMRVLATDTKFRAEGVEDE